MDFKRAFAQILLISALATAAAPGWCAKDIVVEASRTVNVNTADAATLAAVLTGVGDSKAQAIVAYRKEHGPFKSPEQLVEVKGIGEALVAKNRDRILVK
jgi:competence ComEA-like helix-hairpin-helix protein